MHFLITGHTGFKGAWLTMLLRSRGHEVSGISLPPENDSLYNYASLKKQLIFEYFKDIRNREDLLKAFSKIGPDYVIHLAAQPLVRESYKDPITTYESNIVGTINVLESIRLTNSIKSALIITTDKVYRNIGKKTGYVENDPLGGLDPYSASKAAADLVTQSWISSLEKIPLGIARAGNVIGGGDWAKDRIIPDFVRTIQNKQKLIIRYPHAIRPWQHVLDCLNGYLQMIEYMTTKKESLILNFGPEADSAKSVLDLINECENHWGIKSQIELSEIDRMKESDVLLLDSTKARTLLNWNDKLNFVESVKFTMDFYKRHASGENAALIMQDQISTYEKMN